MQVIHVNFKTKEVTKVQEVSVEKVEFEEVGHCSSCIDKAFYNAEEEILIVRFTNTGDYYLYEDCDESTFDSIFNNGSIGRRYWKYRDYMTAKGQISGDTLKALIA